jgi:5-methylcytosine-specific restriction endonuclease McrA
MEGWIMDNDKLDQVVAKARQSREERSKGYREQALKLFPWICGRCGREFTQQGLQELTVHHKDHDHDNNPADGSNWELLCLYCHDNEHSRYEEEVARGGSTSAGEVSATATSKPFADLKEMLQEK